MSKIDLTTAAIVAKNLKTLMDHFDLTVYGVEAGTELEVHTINKILNCRTNLSTISAKKITDFFGITVDLLFSAKPLKLKKLENTPTLKKFFDENPLNNKYYKSRHTGNVVAKFMRNVLIYDPILKSGQRAGKIAEHIEEKYKKQFNHDTIRKELERMYKDGILDRQDKTGKGSVFYYLLKT